jgi:hypothetical protein
MKNNIIVFSLCGNEDGGGMYGKPVAMREDSIELDFYPAEKFFGNIYMN